MKIAQLGLASLALTVLPMTGCTKGDGDDDTTAGSSDSDTTGATTATTTAGTESSSATATTSAGSNSGTGGTGASTATATDSTTATTTTAGTGGKGCASNEECGLFSDCCSCEPVLLGGDEPPMCEKACEEMTCESWGIRGATCRDGSCVLTPVNCDDSTVTCDGPVPLCPDGFSPNVTADGTCYTGKCTPNEYCAM